MKYYVFCCTLLLISFVKAKTKEEILNTCLDGKYHKSTPGPEDELFNQCTPWKKRSCCTNGTSHSVHEGNLYALKYNHCIGRKPLSDKCLNHFIQDHCFYECSPNVGPWIQMEPHRSWRNERYFGVPLCADDCESWFNDCKSDYTCVDNWSRNFDWVTIDSSTSIHGEGSKCPNNATTCKVNVCPKETSCVTFLEIFGTAKNFCEKIWDGSWKYTSDKKPCMRLWFSGKTHNPNDNVAAYFADKLVSKASATLSNFGLVIAFLTILNSLI